MNPSYDAMCTTCGTNEVSNAERTQCGTCNFLHKSKFFLLEFSFLHKKLVSHQADIQILDLFVIIEPTIPGLFCPPGSKVVGDACQVCPVGTYNDAENTTSCNQCPNWNNN